MGQLAEYNTPLATEQALKFRAWRAKLPPELQNMNDYDLQGAFLSEQQASSNNHMTDKYKKPNHMTFSDESQYSTPQHLGGHWQEGSGGRWQFSPSPFNLQQHPPQQLQQYFHNYEPDAALILPRRK